LELGSILGLEHSVSRGGDEKCGNACVAAARSASVDGFSAVGRGDFEHETLKVIVARSGCVWWGIWNRNGAVPHSVQTKKVQRRSGMGAETDFNGWVPAGRFDMGSHD
jgi:hypothetical protein